MTYIKIFYKKCESTLNCKISESKSTLREELTRSILKKAALYKKQSDEENFVPYTDPTNTKGL